MRRTDFIDTSRSDETNFNISFSKYEIKIIPKNMCRMRFYTMLHISGEDDLSSASKYKVLDCLISLCTHYSELL